MVDRTDESRQAGRQLPYVIFSNAPRPQCKREWRRGGAVPDVPFHIPILRGIPHNVEFVRKSSEGKRLSFVDSKGPPSCHKEGSRRWKVTGRWFIYVQPKETNKFKPSSRTIWRPFRTWIYFTIFGTEITSLDTFLLLSKLSNMTRISFLFSKEKEALDFNCTSLNCLVVLFSTWRVTLFSFRSHGQVVDSNPRLHFAWELTWRSKKQLWIVKCALCGIGIWSPKCVRQCSIRMKLSADLSLKLGKVSLNLNSQQ